MITMVSFGLKFYGRGLGLYKTLDIKIDLKEGLDQKVARKEKGLQS